MKSLTSPLVMAMERVTRNRIGLEPLENRPGTGTKTVCDRFQIGANRGTVKPLKKVVRTVKPLEKTARTGLKNRRPERFTRPNGSLEPELCGSPGLAVFWNRSKN